MIQMDRSNPSPKAVVWRRLLPLLEASGSTMVSTCTQIGVTQRRKRKRSVLHPLSRLCPISKGFIWDIKLLYNEQSDIVLLEFLRMRISMT
ncbi:hypothetical protein B296_00048111 [Ensete ventricosum]|uniref:Uncharacterized protein n=1 Tax=Ensete ventricosum TaxID=4639 RepID=A0A426YW83_ENSVE|nr:hypothetical protein B296_00048111 [Ensete ventricosum]